MWYNMCMGRTKGIIFTHDLWRGYLWYAKGLDIPFTLTQSDIEEISQLPCFFCEQKGKTTLGYKTVLSNQTFQPYKANKLVTLDVSKGYIYENVVPCCIYHLKGKKWKSTPNVK